MACCIPSRVIERQGPDGILRARRSTAREQQPRNLGDLELWEGVQQPGLSRQDITQVGIDKLPGTEWDTECDKTALRRGERKVANPNWRVRGESKHARWQGASSIPDPGFGSI